MNYVLLVLLSLVSLKRLLHFCARGAHVVRRKSNTPVFWALYLALGNRQKKKIPTSEYPNRARRRAPQFGWVTVALHWQNLVG